MIRFSGALWACLHIVYNRPLTLSGFYFVAGVMGGWVFLKCRSLFPLFLLHALWNLTVEFGHDVLVISQPDFLPSLLEG
jgi:membrane protease YdiL (CAAX protease family)